MSSDEARPMVDVADAHRYFSVQCFNQTWTLIETAGRTAAEDEAMLLCAMASLWHWTQRGDRSDQNLSVGHWQVSRVYSLLQRGEEAMHHARQCLAYAAGAAPFYVGYSHEAVARAAEVQGNESLAREHLRLAQVCIAAITDEGAKAALERDLRSISIGGGGIA